MYRTCNRLNKFNSRKGVTAFSISVDYTDSSETIKSVHGFSLETELAQIGLYEFHVNDEDAADMEVTEYSKDNYDSDGNFIPTTFYREISPDDSRETADFKRRHSLLHRVLADKAPHWSIGYVTPYIAMDEKSQPQRKAALSLYLIPPAGKSTVTACATASTRQQENS